MNAKTFTAKTIQTKMSKQGWSMEDFCAHYECTEDEFVTRLKQLYHTDKKPRDILEKISKNGSKKKSPKETEVFEEFMETESAEAFEESKENEDTGVMETTNETALEEAMKRRAEIQKKMSEIDASKDEVESSIRADTTKVDEVKKVLDDILAQVAKHRATMEDLISGIEANQCLLKELNNKMEVAKKENEEVTLLIQSLQVVKISCGIEESEAIDYIVLEREDLSNDCINEKMHEFLKNDDIAIFLEDFSVRELKVLARAVLVYERVKTQKTGQKVEMHFGAKYANIAEVFELFA